MKELEFKDRVPTQPGRIKLSPVANEPDTFIMERADEPIFEGTPVNKAAFDSIILSRLTGRYYELTVSNVETSLVSGITTNPLPTSGWMVVSEGKATNGQYIIEASSSSGEGNTPEKACDGDNTTGWANERDYYDSMEHRWSIRSEAPIRVNKIKISMEESNGNGAKFKIQGNKEYNGLFHDLTDWISFTNTNGLKEYTIETPDFYKGYAITFDSLESGYVVMFEFQISNYDIATYKNHFTLEGVPELWTVGQRIMVQVPSSVSSGGIVENTLNGIIVNTILQVSKRYELIYNGTSFDAKEV